jgi:hypothetical protein
MKLIDMGYLGNVDILFRPLIILTRIFWKDSIMRAHFLIIKV